MDDLTKLDLDSKREHTITILHKIRDNMFIPAPKVISSLLSDINLIIRNDISLLQQPGFRLEQLALIRELVILLREALMANTEFREIVVFENKVIRDELNDLLAEFNDVKNSVQVSSDEKFQVTSQIILLTLAIH